MEGTTKRHRGERGKQSKECTLRKLQKEATTYTRIYQTLYYRVSRNTEDAFLNYEDYYWSQQEMAGVKQVITAIKKRINIYQELLKSNQKQEAQQCD